MAFPCPEYAWSEIMHSKNVVDETVRMGIVFHNGKTAHRPISDFNRWATDQYNLG